ncbi:MarR family winged helix-turn-helix transcriptional regulator [Listeria ilorinensis]|uniref:MarR family winged helix-turn-helix transcriptional regulator n=1 Tax=Listeria ilorinensis TaxID=2867439 RepID=UPI001EF691CC|nr:MarR family transcriptional regulator [Listeria ilorinensis]
MDENLVREVVLSFRDVHKKINHFLAVEAARHGITVVQLLALGLIRKEPHLTLGELSERMKLSKSTASGIVDRLVKAGFLTRARNAENRRALNLALTKAGEEKASETYELFFKRLEPILEAGSEPLHELLETHRAILAILEREGSKNT